MFNFVDLGYYTCIIILYFSVQVLGGYMGNKEFSSMIRILRSNNNLTMQELANQLGVTKGAVSMWENKGIVPREDVLIDISKKYNISIDKLLGNDIEIDDASNSKLSYIQRNLSKLDDEQLKKAESVLKVVFDDIFEDDEGEDDDL